MKDIIVKNLNPFSKNVVVNCKHIIANFIPKKTCYMNIFISFIFQSVIFGSWDIQDISLEYGQRTGVKFNSLKKFLTVPYILMSLWEWPIL
jgi:hypothetical protein